MKHKILSLFLTLAMVAGLFSAGTLTAHATPTVGAITVTIKTKTDTTGTSVSGASLKTIMDSTPLNTTTSIEITAGEVTTADWDYFITNRAKLTTFTDFKVADTVTTVADIPDSAGVFPVSLKKVDIAKVKSIGTKAFENCQMLITANIPVAINIGARAFSECSSLTTVNFPLVTSIGDFAFENCRKLTTANIPLVTSLGYSAFDYCCSLTAVNFPLVTSISDFAFYNCSSLTTANIPLATSIGWQGFNECLSLTAANFPLATKIGAKAFSSCKSLTSAKIPAVTSIGEYAFCACQKLTIINLPLVTSIAEGAFYGCTSLITATFPAVTSIEGLAFTDCTALSTLKLAATPPSVNYNNVFVNCLEGRSLAFVNASGVDLTGAASVAAQTAYKEALGDGDATDNYWYGWDIIKTSSPSVSISGNAQVGKTLTATVYSTDANVSYQWQTDGNNVGADSNTYVVQAADVGKKITVTVTGTDIYIGRVTSPATSAVLAASADQTTASPAYANDLIPDNDPTTPNLIGKLCNDYAYIYGKDDTTMAPEDSISRSEASALLFRLLKQNNKLNGYSKPADSSFQDLKGDEWYDNSLEFMTYLGVYNKKCTDDTIFAYRPITRGEAAKLFAFAMGIAPTADGNAFTDLDKSNRYYKYINALAVGGYMHGDADTNQVRPNDELTRAEFVVIYNAIVGRNVSDYDYTTDVNGNAVTCPYTDLSPTAWYYDDIMRAAFSYTNGKVDPSKRLDRNTLDK